MPKIEPFWIGHWLALLIVNNRKLRPMPRKLTFFLLKIKSFSELTAPSRSEEMRENISAVTQKVQ